MNTQAGWCYPHCDVVEPVRCEVMIKQVTPSLLLFSPCLMQRAAFLLLTPSPHLCPALPRLLAFHTRPLSNPREEADGPGFLCTNQEGICSCTDTSPLTRASSHIHYSFSQRWAAVQGWEQSGGCADWVKEDTGWGWWVHVVLCSCCHLILIFKCPLVLRTRQRTSWDISIKTVFFLYVLFVPLHSIPLTFHVFYGNLGLTWKGSWAEWFSCFILTNRKLVKFDFLLTQNF